MLKEHTKVQTESIVSDFFLVFFFTLHIHYGCLLQIFLHVGACLNEPF